MEKIPEKEKEKLLSYRSNINKKDYINYYVYGATKYTLYFSKY